MFVQIILLTTKESGGGDGRDLPSPSLEFQDLKNKRKYFLVVVGRHPSCCFCGCFSLLKLGLVSVLEHYLSILASSKHRGSQGHSEGKDANRQVKSMYHSFIPMLILAQTFPSDFSLPLLLPITLSAVPPQLFLEPHVKWYQVIDPQYKQACMKRRKALFST